MKIKLTTLVLLVSVILASCKPAVSGIPKETSVPTSTSTPHLPTPTPIPTFTPTPLPTPLPFPSNVTLKLNGERVDAATPHDPNVAIIQQAISVVSNEVSKRGYSVGSITAYLATTKDSFLSQYIEAHKNAGSPISESQARQNIEAGLDGEAAGGFLVLFIGGEKWKRSVPDRYTQISHEFFHTIQMDLAHKSGFGNENKPGPIWLIEGSASYFASAIDCKYGLTPNWYGWDWNSANQIFPGTKLSETIAIGYSNESPYVLGIAATALLVVKFGEDKIYEYFNLNHKEGWKRAFEDAFGLTVNEFYLQFEQERDALNNIPQPVCSQK